ncbi:hydroxymethylglutaryl-CoA lyase [Echinicola pacifica]|uniref:Hydroxymethylglutaryl-CoA lyase n=1 Tax=Echinicola pacifica TaxID=346377 RepID=A0A918Q2M5_9BACT|nr:hypothetical protein [Echinicola pacifica]GGZ30856.1 hydroxymethylglutaryl-CoA lyase [Echinicola pacifica]
MKIIECPRDAMQGKDEFIDTAIKAAYINQLLNIGFDTVDFGSFVSPKAIPQMRDTAELLDLLDLFRSRSKLLAIIANTRGASDALHFEEIDYLGFPLSLSETFQQKNTNKSIAEALETVEDIQNLCETKGKELVIYLSMGFGNPYGEAYNGELVAEFVNKLNAIGIRTIALSDTIGAASPALISSVFQLNVETYPQIEFGAHFHSRPDKVEEKILAGIQGGCRRFDGAIQGHGGCPFATDELVGNVATEKVIEIIESQGFTLGLNMEEFHEAEKLAQFVFQ